MKRVSFLIVLLGIFAFMPTVSAKGNATVEFESVNVVEVGDTFTVNMVVDNVNSTYDGIVSFGGNLVFDESVIRYVSMEKISTPYEFHINTEANYKLAGLDFTLDNGIRTRTVVYTFTFEALKEGSTEINFVNVKLTDSQDYVNTTVNSNVIQVVDKEDIKVEEKQVETKETEEEIKSEIIEETETKDEIIVKVQDKKETNIELFTAKLKRVYNIFKKLFK